MNVHRLTLNRSSQLAAATRGWTGYTIGAVCAVWFACVLAGMGVLWRYEATPGPASAAPASWPAEQLSSPHGKLPTLVMFAHPRCPCTRASLEELAILMTRSQGRVDARVLFFQPAEFGPEWSTTDLYQTAQDIPGVSVSLDADNVLARKFDAKTSGHTLLFSPQGQLLFSGGITAARGHIGDNAGYDALTEAINGRQPAVKSTQVFGCPLYGPEQE